MGEVSPSFITGGGGDYFESKIGAAFAVLMLTDSLIPCLPQHRIQGILFQARYKGYQTDDFVAYTRTPYSSHEHKLLVQVKHKIAFRKSDTELRSVIEAAWQDFNNRELFDPLYDAIALVTGPLSIIDTSYVHPLFDEARSCNNADEFFNKVNRAKFYSKKKRDKLDILKSLIEDANKKPITQEEFWNFLKCFHLLGYDLDLRLGVTLSLIQALIGHYSQEEAEQLWTLILRDVQEAKSCAASLTPDRMSDLVRKAFIPKDAVTIPEEALSPRSSEGKKINPQDIIPAILLGGWCESNASDIEAIRLLTRESYSSWISKIRGILDSSNVLAYENKEWKISDHRRAWCEFASSMLDQDLENFADTAIKILSEQHPKFSLPPENRSFAALHDMHLAHSDLLRTGIAETLALLGNHSSNERWSYRLTTSIPYRVLSKVLQDADWKTWASLNELLPALAEAAPKKFLTIIEQVLQKEPGPFDFLYSEMNESPLWGTNYTSGLLWALETLAWDADFFDRAILLLGELAEKDSGGRWGNKPSTSLTMILLPWRPQTFAPASQMLAAVSKLLRDSPKIGWNLLVSLLPRVTRTSTPTRKPTWRKQNENLQYPPSDYEEQILRYSKLAVDAAEQAPEKLTKLIEIASHFPQDGFDYFMEHLKNADIDSMSETELFIIWNAVIKLTSEHRHFPEARWAMEKERLEEFEDLIDIYAPRESSSRLKRLFCKDDENLIEEEGSYSQQISKLLEKRQSAIQEIYTNNGVDAVLSFATQVDSPFQVGFAFGCISDRRDDRKILPDLLKKDDKSYVEFIEGYVKGKYRIHGRDWGDSINLTSWSRCQLGIFLTYLPFEPKTWNYSAKLLQGDESPYWSTVNIYYIDDNDALEKAASQLLKYNRPLAALDCLYFILSSKGSPDSQKVIQALTSIAKDPCSAKALRKDDAIQLIDYLQQDTSVSSKDLAQIEFQYLQLLDDNYLDVRPKALEQRLADEPLFFCYAIQAVFKSTRDKEDIKLSPKEESIATNLFYLLENWRTPPGLKEDGTFDNASFESWLKAVKKTSKDTGHLDIAMNLVGQVLIYTPNDPKGLWIPHSVAAALDARDGEKLLEGFITALFNSRGAFWIDPEAKEEKGYEKKYREWAQALEANPFYYPRFAAKLRDLADDYATEIERREAGVDDW